jgi:hypothetical protein
MADQQGVGEAVMGATLRYPSQLSGEPGNVARQYAAKGPSRRGPPPICAVQGRGQGRQGVQHLP